jgi:hypothetical protein
MHMRRRSMMLTGLWSTRCKDGKDMADTLKPLYKTN